MDRSQVLAFMRSQRHAVQASTSPAGATQAAVVGIAINDRFEIVFDTLAHTRKAHNLRNNPHIALVVGGLVDGDERTVQYEGSACFPEGSELEQAQADYFAAISDGPNRLSWPGITYVKVKPRWLRYSDYNRTPPEIVEFNFGGTN